MKRHQEIRDTLYDYLAGTLDAAQRGEVERHLQTCDECRGDLALLREALALLPKSEKDPADARPQAFWDAFPFRVEQSIRARHRHRPLGLVRRIGDHVLSFAVMRKGQIALVSTAAGLCALALVLMLRPGSTPVAEGPHPDTASSVTSSPPQLAAEGGMGRAPETSSVHPQGGASTPVTAVNAERVSEYFRKSKILLIGVANLKEDHDAPPDLSTERSVSRSLVKEARYIREEPGLNPKAKELIDELNRVLIQLANLSEQDDASGIEIIRGGIRQENLLFKIRMAEDAFEAARPIQATSKREGSSL